MRTLTLMALATLTLAGCDSPENQVSIPDGPGAWLIMDESITSQTGEATVASRTADGKTTVVHGVYTTQGAGFGLRYIEVKAECGVMHFQRIADRLEFKDQERASRAAGARSCGFGERLRYARWKLIN